MEFELFTKKLANTEHCKTYKIMTWCSPLGGYSEGHFAVWVGSNSFVICSHAFSSFFAD